MKKGDKLHTYWSKRDKDLVTSYPLGVCTKADCRYLCDLFDEKFEKEMEERGYDITTMRFSIEPKAGKQKFASQRTEPKKDGTE